LDSTTAHWNAMTDAEYRLVFTAFRTLVENDNAPLSGDKAYELLASRAAHAVWLFNTPGYKGVPVAPNAHEGTYGYCVAGLSRLDREEMNRLEMVVTDADVKYACVFNHEWQAVAPELWYGECA